MDIVFVHHKGIVGKSTSCIGVDGWLMSNVDGWLTRKGKRCSCGPRRC